MSDRIKIEGGKLIVPDKPIIPFIEGDGIGKDITGPSQRVIDAAVKKAYGAARQLMWKEVLAGEKAFKETVENHSISSCVKDANIATKSYCSIDWILFAREKHRSSIIF